MAKVKRYSVSVQWGDGFHYFLGYASREEEARKLFSTHRPTIRRKGAKPKIYLWELRDAKRFTVPTEPAASRQVRYPSKQRFGNTNRRSRLPDKPAVCTNCSPLIPLPPEQFPRTSKGMLCSWCRTCMKLASNDSKLKRALLGKPTEPVRKSMVGKTAP